MSLVVLGKRHAIDHRGAVDGAADERQVLAFLMGALK